MTNPNDPNQPPGGYGPPPPPGGGYGPPPGGGGGYGPPPGGGYGGPPAASSSSGPMIMGIIGIVCWLCCAPVSIVLGLIGQSQATKSGQSATLPRIAWIGGIVVLVLNVIVYFAYYLPNR